MVQILQSKTYYFYSYFYTLLGWHQHQAEVLLNAKSSVCQIVRSCVVWPLLSNIKIALFICDKLVIDKTRLHQNCWCRVCNSLNQRLSDSISLRLSQLLWHLPVQWDRVDQHFALEKEWIALNHNQENYWCGPSTILTIINSENHRISAVLFCQQHLLYIHCIVHEWN